MNNETTNRRPVGKSPSSSLDRKTLWLVGHLLKWLFLTIPKAPIRLFIYRIDRIWATNGRVFLVLYLKECVRLVQHFLSGNPCKASLGLPVGLAGGLPSIIPGYFRALIRKDRGRSIWEIRLVLTVLSVYRIIQIPGQLKLETITNPYSGLMSDFPAADWTDALHSLLELGGLKLGTDLQKKLRSFSPFHLVLSGATGPNNRSSLLGLYDDVLYWARSPDSVLLLYSFVENFTGGKEWLDKIFGSICDYKYVHEDRTPYGGRLSTKEEPAGKIRIFAITDLVTQMVMAPLHKALFFILKRLPMDGTFDQNAPLDRLRNMPNPNNEVFYSYDLSSATDRLPIRLQSTVLKILFGCESIGDSWASILTDRYWTLLGSSDASVKTPISLKYSVGQPMGALSSWAMLALTHHLIVQYCALKCGIYNFSDYALLGDDIVIRHREVAKYYYRFMTKDLGVEINEYKSLISPDTFEFAKRLININAGEFSPLSPANLLATIYSPRAVISLLRDAHQKGWALSEAMVDSLLSRIPTIAARHYEDLIWAVKGPFGFITTDSGLSSSMRMSSSLLPVRLDSLLSSIDDAIYCFNREAWESEIPRTVNILLKLQLSDPYENMDHIKDYILSDYSRRWVEFICNPPIRRYIFNYPLFDTAPNKVQLMRAEIEKKVRTSSLRSRALLDPFKYDRSGISSVSLTKSAEFFAVVRHFEESKDEARLAHKEELAVTTTED